MKLKSIHVMLAAAGVGVIMILMGLLQAMHLVTLSDKLTKDGSSWLLVIAAILFVYGNRLRRTEAEERKDLASEDSTDQKSPENE